jgi:Tfp pilus assembly PilM family ATPase
LARFLALDWDHNQLHVISAAVSGTAVRLQKAVLIAEDKSPNPAEGEELGRRLREHLKAAGVAPAPVLACVGRERTILKEVRYPKVPPAEEPAVVRFQAAKELTEPPEEVVIDYAPAGEAAPGGEQRALVLVARRELVGAYQAICQAAGLKLLALTPRPLGLLTALPAGAAAPDEAVAVLALGERWAELCVARGEALLFARSLAAGPALAGEVRRSLAVYGGQWPQSPVRRLFVADSGEHAALAGRLRDALGVPVTSFDPLAGLDAPASGRGSFAAAAGLLQAQARRRPPAVNFVRPKEPRPARDPNRARLVAAAAALGVLLLGTVGFGYAQVARKDREIEALQAEKTALDRVVLDVEEDARRIKALEEWSQGQIVWLDELYDLTDHFGDTNSMRLVQLAGEPLASSAKGKNAPKQVARMALKGITTDDYQAVDALLAGLVADGHYRVEPKQLKRNTGVDRFRFRQEFTTRLDLEPRPPTAYVRRLTSPGDEEERPPRPRNGRGRPQRGRGTPDFGTGGFGGGQP